MAAELLFNRCHETHGEKRVAAEKEEVVFDTDGPDIENLLPNGYKLLLDGIAGRAEGARAGAARGFGSGKGIAVDFAVGGQGKRFDVDKNPGDHVVGQLSLKVAAQGGGVSGVGIADDVGGKRVGARGIESRNHGALLYAWRLREGGLDFTKLNAMASDLHLVVAAAEEDDSAIGSEAREVAGVVEPGPGLTAQCVRNETLCG